jgi:sec-independent protein translocase protein TatA
MDSMTFAIFGLPGGAEWIIILLVALLLFGRRLPDVARSMGKSIVVFKRGLNDVKDEIDKSGEDTPSQSLPPAGSSSQSDDKK